MVVEHAVSICKALVNLDNQTSRDRGKRRKKIRKCHLMN